MENENKDIFDYDEYIKSNTAKEKPKKGFWNRKKAQAKQEKQPAEVKSETPKEKKPSEVKADAPKDKKPPEIKADAPKDKKPSEVKTDAPKEKKPPEVKADAPKDKKPSEVKADAPKEKKPPEVKADAPKDKKPSEVKADAPKDKKPSEVKTDAPKDKKPSEVKTDAPKDKKPPEVKTDAPKEKKPPEVKTDAPKEKKPPEVKTDASKNKKPSEVKTDASKDKKEKKTDALKNAGKKMHAPSKKEKPLKITEESIDNIKKMFDDALSEDKEDLADLVTEEPVPEIPAAASVNKSKFYFALGLAVAFFAVIGIISTVMFSMDKFREFTDNTHQKDEFAQFIYPVVICDPAPFDQTMKMHNDTILSAAIWDIILYEDKSKYEHDFDYITVPQVDVEKHAVKLFGEGLSFVHKSLLNSEVKFHYEEELSSYRIPAKPRYFTYSPYVEGIEREGENYLLTVGYISPTPAYFALNKETDTPTPDKYVEYLVKKQGDEYTLLEIRISEKGRDLHLGL